MVAAMKGIGRTLNIDWPSHPVCVVLHAGSARAVEEGVVDLFLHILRSPAVHIVSSFECALFAHGRISGVVVDCSASWTAVATVEEQLGGLVAGSLRRYPACAARGGLNLGDGWRGARVLAVLLSTPVGATHMMCVFPLSVCGRAYSTLTAEAVAEMLNESSSTLPDAAHRISARAAVVICGEGVRADLVRGIRQILPARTAVLPRPEDLELSTSLAWMGGSLLIDVGVPEEVWLTDDGLQRAVQASGGGGAREAG